MLSAVAAYLLMFFVIAPLAGFLPVMSMMIITPLGALPCGKAVFSIAYFFAGAATAYLALKLGLWLFSWFEVSYHWYSYLMTMVPILTNDLRRGLSNVIEFPAVLGTVTGAAYVLFNLQELVR